MLSGMPIKFGASPLNWWFGLPIPQNLIPTADDILREIAETGYAGTELGGAMPSDPAKLTPLLEKHDVELAGGWFGAELLSQPFEDQKKKFTDFMMDLKRMGSKTVVIAETTHVPIGLPYADQVYKDVLTENLFPYTLPFLRDHEWKTLADGLEVFWNPGPTTGHATGIPRSYATAGAGPVANRTVDGGSTIPDLLRTRGTCTLRGWTRPR